MKALYASQIVRKFTIASAICLVAGQAVAAIIGVAGGDAAPPANLGPFTMTLFGPDARAEFDDVNSVPSPLGGDVAFSSDLTHLAVGSGWVSWSHGYLGDVYWTDGDLSVSLTLPLNTAAFFFYAQPNLAQSFEMDAESQDGTVVSQIVDGNGGASFYGFYASGGDQITSITFSSSQDFAIGEFGIATARGVVPDSTPWAPGIAALALAGFARFQRCKSCSRIAS